MKRQITEKLRKQRREATARYYAKKKAQGYKRVQYMEKIEKVETCCEKDSILAD